MFGMLRPARATLAYRSTYARCCQHLRRVAGLSALPVLSYEAVLLYQVAVDAGRVDMGGLRSVRCCKLRALPGHCGDRDVGEFCARVGLLLAAIKVSDDRRDGGPLAVRLFGWLLRRRFDATRAYFSRIDPHFTAVVDGFIAEHLALEHGGAAVSLAEYVRPTARAFGYVFGLLARLPGLETRADLLTRLGECVGSAVISYDCAVDRDRDARRGDFNPLPEGDEAVPAALCFSRAALEQARRHCESAFGPAALTAATLQGVSERVSNVGRRLACPRCAAEVQRALQGWGLAQPRGTLQLRSVVGLGGLATVLVGLAARLLSSAAPGGPTNPPVPGAADVPGAPVVPRPRRTAGSGSCGSLSCCDGGDSVVCCCEGADCAVDNSCDGCQNFGNCADCGGGCDGCSGCDCSC